MRRNALRMLAEFYNKPNMEFLLFFYHPVGQEKYLGYSLRSVYKIWDGTHELPLEETRYFDYDSACVVRV